MSNKFLLILLFVFASANARMIYRRYQKEHKNYVQIVEIFETKRRPPQFIENEKALNDFLGRDAFKTDMNCTDENVNGNPTQKNQSTKRPNLSSSTQRPPKSTTKSIPTTTPRNFIPTTVYMDHMVTYSPPPFPKLPQHPTRAKSPTRQPNLDNLFTIRSTKPTIKANPKENENPDYTNLFRPTNLPVDQENLNDNKRVYGHRPNNDEYIDNENEYEQSNSVEYDEFPPDEDFGESDEEGDDDIINRRKRFY